MEERFPTGGTRRHPCGLPSWARSLGARAGRRSRPSAFRAGQDEAFPAQPLQPLGHGRAPRLRRFRQLARLRGLLPQQDQHLLVGRPARRVDLRLARAAGALAPANKFLDKHVQCSHYVPSHNGERLVRSLRTGPLRIERRTPLRCRLLVGNGASRVTMVLGAHFGRFNHKTLTDKANRRKFLERKSNLLLVSWNSGGSFLEVLWKAFRAFSNGARRPRGIQVRAPGPPEATRPTRVIMSGTRAPSGAMTVPVGRDPR